MGIRRFFCRRWRICSLLTFCITVLVVHLLFLTLMFPDSVVEKQGLKHLQLLNEHSLPVEMTTTILTPSASWCSYQSLKKALKEKALNQEVYIQVIPDAQHVVLARNTLDTLERRTRKTNILFICLHPMQCGVTSRYNISCYIPTELPKVNVTQADYAAVVFSELYRVLLLNHTFIYTDFDTSLRKPIAFAKDSDLTIPYGVTAKAHSFYRADSTKPSKQLHKFAQNLALTGKSRTFASAFRSSLNRFLKLNPPLQVGTPVNCERGKTQSDVDCPVLRHPTVRSPAERILWLKEKQMWLYDQDGYFSDPKARYLTYENTIDMHQQTPKYELNALKNALAYGAILGRIVILPRFHQWLCPGGKPCKTSSCLLSKHINMTTFEEQFHGAYRAHAFRGHPLVPMPLKRNTSAILRLDSPIQAAMVAAGGERLKDAQVTKRDKEVLIKPNDSRKGPDSDEVLDLFSKYQHIHILRFDNFYGPFSGFIGAAESLQFENKLKRAAMPLSTN